jgi:hypothetical protein
MVAPGGIDKAVRLGLGVLCCSLVVLAASCAMTRSDASAVEEQIRSAIELDLNLRELPNGLEPGHISSAQALAIRQSALDRLSKVATGQFYQDQLASLDDWLDRVVKDESTEVWDRGTVSNLQFHGPPVVDGSGATASGSYTFLLLMHRLANGTRVDEWDGWPMNFTATLSRERGVWLVATLDLQFPSPGAVST